MISSDHARTSATSLFRTIELRPVKQCAEIAGVWAAALCWLVVLKSTRALKIYVLCGLIEFTLAFSQTAQRVECAGLYVEYFLFQAARPEPARRGRLWSGPTLFKRAEVLYEIDASTGLENPDSVRYVTARYYVASVRKGKNR